VEKVTATGLWSGTREESEYQTRGTTPQPGGCTPPLRIRGSSRSPFPSGAYRRGGSRATGGACSGVNNAGNSLSGFGISDRARRKSALAICAGSGKILSVFCRHAPRRRFRPPRTIGAHPRVNEVRGLDPCSRSCARRSRASAVPWEIVMVDDGSRDGKGGSESSTSREATPGCATVLLGENGGQSDGARGRAVEPRASGADHK